MQAKTSIEAKRPLRIKFALKRAGITHAEVARAAGVHFTVVSHVLARRVVSANVVNTAIRLLAEHADESAVRP